MLSQLAKDPANFTDQLESSPSSYTGPGDWQMEPSKVWQTHILNILNRDLRMLLMVPVVSLWKLLQGMESGNGFKRVKRVTKGYVGQNRYGNKGGIKDINLAFRNRESSSAEVGQKQKMGI